MEMQVRKFVTVGTVIDLLRIECLLHGTGHLSHISHEGIAIFVTQFIQVVHMVLIGHEATATIGLFLKEKGSRHRQLGELNHQVVKCLIVSAVQTLLGITLHSRLFLDSEFVLQNYAFYLEIPNIMRIFAP